MTVDPCDEAAVLDTVGLAELISHLERSGYTVLGPCVHDGAIVYDELAGAGDLPTGWGDEQAPGHYRLRRRDDDARFGYTVGPDSWKRFLFPPSARVWTGRRGGDGSLRYEPEPPQHRRLALVGVRACDLAAIARLDTVLLGGTYSDASYEARRADLFVVAVTCAEPAPTCFCTSMGTGPSPTAGFDLALTEVLVGDTPWYLAETGTAAGRLTLAKLPHRQAEPAELEAARAVARTAATRISRRLRTSGLRGALLEGLSDREHWDELGTRCLSCASCTLACPTCFCTQSHDTSDLTSSVSERWRAWDSCFTLDFSHLVSGPIRASAGARYRHWITHKLATWHDQFGESGCVGCGRCITWCPVGIDITEEAAAMAAPTRIHVRSA